MSVTDLVTPLKEAWKWSLGPRLALHLGLTLDSGALAPLMLTLNMEYADDSLVNKSKIQEMLRLAQLNDEFINE